MFPMINLAALFLLPSWRVLRSRAIALQTVAEQSGYKATARHGEVVALCQELARRYPNAQYSELGHSAEGRPLPLLILADPPVHTAEEAARSGKLVVLAIGNIHAGEVCGKEALPMLAREILELPGSRSAQGPDHRPGPDLQRRRQRAGLEDRTGPGQNGPEEGMGQRANARGLDLNRDFIKLEAPETRALVRVLQHVEAAPVHRHAHDQRLAPPLHDHLRRAQEPGGRPQGHRLHAHRVLPRGHQRFREEDGLDRRITTATSTAITRSGRAFPPRGGTARLMSACETGCRCSPRPTPTPRSRIACWPPAISSASA